VGDHAAPFDVNFLLHPRCGKTAAEPRREGCSPGIFGIYQGMITFLTVLVVLGMIGTLATLFAGMVGIARPGSNPRRSNRLMQLRVIFQGVTLVLFALLLLALRH
jgi:hypothetical protein